MTRERGNIADWPPGPIERRGTEPEPEQSYLTDG